MPKKKTNIVIEGQVCDNCGEGEIEAAVISFENDETFLPVLICRECCTYEPIE